jgi:hypothetical protein
METRDVRVDKCAITPSCRDGRGAEAAWNEACCRLKARYDEVLAGWGDQGHAVTLRLELVLERPA